MNILIAFILGLVEGVTGLLPVSASGLTVTIGSLMGFDALPPVFFSAVLHAGTAAVIVSVMWKSVINLIIDFFVIIKDLLINLVLYFRNMGRDVPVEYRRIIDSNHKCICAMVVIASVPTVIMGIVLEKLVVSSFSSYLMLGMGFLITAIMLIVTGVVPSKVCKLREEPFKRCFWSGIVQGIALFPGISRTGMVFACSRLSGLSKKAAIRITMLLMIPSVAGALIFEIKKADNGIVMDGTSIACMAAGIAASFIIGRILFRFSVKILKGRAVRNFAYINVIAAVAAILGHFLSA